MGAFGQFKALFIKNLLSMKRNILLSIIEITFPIGLVFIGFLVRKAFKTEEHHFSEEGSLSNFITDKSNMGMNLYQLYKNMPLVAMTLLEMNDPGSIKNILSSKILNKSFTDDSLTSLITLILSYDMSQPHQEIVLNFTQSLPSETIQNLSPAKMAQFISILAPDELSTFETLNTTEQIYQLIYKVYTLFSLDQTSLNTYLDSVSKGDYPGFVYKLLNVLSDSSSSNIIQNLLSETGSSVNTSKLQDFTDVQISEYNKLLENTSLSLEKWVWTDKAKTDHNINIPSYKGFSLKPLAINCFNRFLVGFVGKEFPEDLIKQIWNILALTDGSVWYQKLNYTTFESISDLESYVTDGDYGKEGKDPICFAVRYDYNETNDKYITSLHYFDNYIMEGIEVNYLIKI